MKCPLLLMFAALTALTSPGAQAQTIAHSRIGDSVKATGGQLTVTTIGKKQNYSYADKETNDPSINSPKSVNIHPNGKKFYVNSLEGYTTVVYDMQTRQKLKTILHQFDGTETQLWAKPSGLFPFTHYSTNLNKFGGKPVEATFSHNGRYLWVPYYRRSYDINAQDPSAMAVIDTEKDEIVKLMETGPLPKMVATSHSGKYVAVTHWGNNTVGIIDIQSENPDEWHYIKCLVVDYQLKLNFPLNRSVDRDNGSGYALRGTVFTPDDKYLIVGCMGGGGGIAVIDMQTNEYLGRVLGMMDNVRHLLINNGYLYLSINRTGYVQRIKLDSFIQAARNMTGKTVRLGGWENCKVGAGARTIEISPSGKYIFAACNLANQLCVVDTRTMTQIAAITADSYPVGLAISDDGTIVMTTSQGRSNGGGNAVDIFRVDYAEPEPVLQRPKPVEQTQTTDTLADAGQANESDNGNVEHPSPSFLLPIVAGCAGVVAIAAICTRAAKNKNKA